MIKSPKTDKFFTGQVQNYSLMLGCDPEFFFEKNNKIIGSEKVIDISNGLKRDNLTGASKFIVDGVQAELNPRPNTCREQLANEIGACFYMLLKHIEKDKDLKVNFKQTVKITKKELNSLAESSRRFGCSPSKNPDPKSRNIVSTRNPATYMYRSAGGHIHLGTTSNYPTDPINCLMHEPERLVNMLDVIVGNTCVLIDRDPGNIERRKVYGRAGEYRTPSYGLEYRTLSNFWLRSYALMSFVFSLCRYTTSLMACSTPGRDFEAEIMSRVDMKDIRRAINRNDAKLARENFEKVRPIIEAITPEGQNFPLTKNGIEDFLYFVEKGLDHWFKEEDTLKQWVKIGAGNGRGYGWESYLINVVRHERMAEIKQKEAEKKEAEKKKKVIKE